MNYPLPGLPSEGEGGDFSSPLGKDNIPPPTGRGIGWGVLSKPSVISVFSVADCSSYFAIDAAWFANSAART